ncbi:MAG: lipoate--protein ligase family protein [Pirellulaceae bacterium]|nr:lipoate--protein ligase family protein [Pirellulaceae bacterium]
MEHLDLTLPTAAENLALDEALLDEAESLGETRETLRIWEAPRPAVVVGRSSRVEQEVCQETCRALDIPVLRRVSGGAAVLAGPGCLMYALVLDYRLRPELRPIDKAHRWVLGRLAEALKPLAPAVACRGTSDLTNAREKISGNSARCRREHVLYHGTLLYDFPLPLIERCLRMPPRTPDYRQGRSHQRFLANLHIDAAVLRQLLIEAFGARHARDDWPTEQTARLVLEKYGRDGWNLAGA